MKKALSWLIFALVAVYGSAYLFHHFPLTTEAQIPEQAQPVAPQPPEAAEANKMVTFAGPLADYAQSENAAKSNPAPTSLGKPDASISLSILPPGPAASYFTKRSLSPPRQGFFSKFPRMPRILNCVAPINLFWGMVVTLPTAMRMSSSF